MNGDRLQLAQRLSRAWWPQLLRGLIAIVFGILAVVWPRLNLPILISLFGAYVLANGLLTLLYAARLPREYPRFGTTIFNGLASIAAAILTFVWPVMNGVRLLIVIAAWAIATGLLEIATAIELRKILREQGLLGLAGLVSWVFGMVLLAQPNAGALAAYAWIGGFAIVFGLLFVLLGFRLRHSSRLPGEPPAIP